MPPISSGLVADPLPVLSVLIPASNEEALIERCLKAVLQSNWPHAQLFETIVISNGSKDRTTDIARALQAQFAEKGIALQVLDRKEGGKLGALNAGDQVAQAPIRVYLDADVVVSRDLISQLYQELDAPSPRYASGTLVLAASQTWATRAYSRIYAKVPFMKFGVPGAGVFAVNAAGRMRWDEFPNIISDDTFVRLSFSPEERVAVPATYTWPLVEGWSNLVRVRRRQNAGVDEIRDIYPDFLLNDDKPPFPIHEKLKLALQDPLGFAVYSGVALVVRLTSGKPSGWSRGR